MVTALVALGSLLLGAVLGALSVVAVAVIAIIAHDPEDRR